MTLQEHSRNILRNRIASARDILDQFLTLEGNLDTFVEAAEKTAFAATHGLIFACGNGGSFSDADHTVGELVGWYDDPSKKRPGTRAILLGGSQASLTAVANDIGYEHIFARQLEPYGTFLQVHDIPSVLLAFTTSGNSPNILGAARVAKRYHIPVVGFLGGNGGKMIEEGLTTFPLLVPSSSTATIQEAHHVLYHSLCDAVEKELKR